MENRRFKMINLCFITVIIAGASLPVFAQKIKSTQDKSIFAGPNVKIDGKLLEWTDNLEAFNKSTMLNYTLANDDKNLYLIIKSSDVVNNNKIIGGGISFIVNTKGAKKGQDQYSITYPVLTRADIRNAAKGWANQKFTPNQRDSAILDLRTKITLSMDEIKIGGFHEVTDSLISIYNEYGIKTTSSFDAKGAFIYELALPLKLLNLSQQNNEFSYHISVNGVPPINAPDNNNGASNPAYLAMISPTSFRGKYVLAVK